MASYHALASTISPTVEIGSGGPRSVGGWSISAEQAREPVPSTQLQEELARRLMEMASYGEGWDGPGSVPPGDEVLGRALALGSKIIARLDFPMNALNISASDSGEVLFTLFGRGNRVAELWLDPADHSAMTCLQYVRTSSAPSTEERFFVEDGVDSVLSWLKDGP